MRIISTNTHLSHHNSFLSLFGAVCRCSYLLATLSSMTNTARTLFSIADSFVLANFGQSVRTPTKYVAGINI